MNVMAICGFLLVAITAWVCFQEWIRERAAAWYKMQQEITKDSEDYSDGQPAPWEDRLARPWYVRFHEWMET